MLDFAGVSVGKHFSEEMKHRSDTRNKRHFLIKGLGCHAETEVATWILDVPLSR